MTVKELLERIDSAELTEWLAYFEIQKEPPPDRFLNRKLDLLFGPREQ